MAYKKKTEKTQPSSVCRVNKNSNYTVMSNFHLRSKTLGLKAVGLLSKVLSLTDEWDYSVAGLASICREGETAIKSALAELKDRGYLTVTKLKPNQTKSGRIEYVYDFYMSILQKMTLIHLNMMTAVTRKMIILKRMEIQQAMLKTPKKFIFKRQKNKA